MNLTTFPKAESGPEPCRRKQHGMKLLLQPCLCYKLERKNSTLSVPKTEVFVYRVRTNPHVILLP